MIPSTQRYVLPVAWLSEHGKILLDLSMPTAYRSDFDRTVLYFLQIHLTNPVPREPDIYSLDT